MNTAIISGPASGTNCQYKTMMIKANVPLSSQLIYPDTKYIIKHNFDLENETIELPVNCIIAIDGGLLSNGTLIGNNSIIIDVNKVGNILNNITKLGVWRENSISIGTITSGDNPDVTVTGDENNPVLNFVFPKGNKVPKVIQTYSSVTIEPNTLNIWDSVPSTITLGNPIEGYVNEYMIRFSTDDISPSITFPTFKNSDEEIINIKWSETLSLEPNATYEISIIDEYGAITKFG